MEKRDRYGGVPRPSSRRARVYSNATANNNNWSSAPPRIVRSYGTTRVAPPGGGGPIIPCGNASASDAFPITAAAADGGSGGGVVLVASRQQTVPRAQTRRILGAGTLVATFFVLCLVLAHSWCPAASLSYYSSSASSLSDMREVKLEDDKASRDDRDKTETITSTWALKVRAFFAVIRASVCVGAVVVMVSGVWL